MDLLLSGRAAARRVTREVRIGQVVVGSGGPIVVQSMTNTDTADDFSTSMQSGPAGPGRVGVVRITVNNDEAAKAVPRIRDKLLSMNLDVPLVGDFHYNGHKLLTTTRPAPRRSTSTHQSRQRRAGCQARHPVCVHRRNGLPLRQAGAHRRQLGQPRPVGAGADHG
jgi:hypothetical protein